MFLAFFQCNGYLFVFTRCATNHFGPPPLHLDLFISKQNRNSFLHSFISIMSLSGVRVSDGAVAAFNELKTKKTGRYVMFQITNDTEITVASVGERSSTYEDFVAKLANDQPAYVIFDFEWETADGPRDKILFISWIPDGCKVKSKMLYASSKAALGTALGGGFVEVAGSDVSDIDRESVMHKLKK